MSKCISFYRISKQSFDNDTSTVYKEGGLYFIFDSTKERGCIYACTAGGNKSTARFEAYSTADSLHFVDYDNIDSSLGVKIYTNPSNYVVIKSDEPLLFASKTSSSVVFTDSVFESTEEGVTNISEYAVYITSAGVKSFVQEGAEFRTKASVDDLLAGKQATLTSGTNIKTVNGYSLLGSGNIEISGGQASEYTAGSNIDITDHVISTKNVPTNTEMTTAITAAISGHASDSSLHVTGAEKVVWNSKQDAIDDLASIRSGASAGATAVQPATLTAHINDGVLHVTTEQKTAWNNKYDKPSTGIPKTDLASNVQTSLGLADTALQSHQSIKTINNNTLTGSGNVTVAGNIYMNGVSKTPTTSGTNIGRVDIGNVAQSIYMNNTSYTPTTGSTNTGRVNLGTVVTAVRVNGSDKSVSSGRVDLGEIYSKSDTNALVENEVAARESAVNAEANTRSQADTNLNNIKQNNINTLTGYSNSNNIVLVSIEGNIQWKPFNNILAGSTTPISSEGNNGDIYIQTQ